MPDDARIVADCMLMAHLGGLTLMVFPVCQAMWNAWKNWRN